MEYAQAKTHVIVWCIIIVNLLTQSVRATNKPYCQARGQGNIESPLKRKGEKMKGHCIHCGRIFTEEDYKKASKGIVGDDCLVGDYDNICYRCQLKYGTDKAKKALGL